MTKILYSCKRSLNIIITLKLPSQSYYYSRLLMVEKKIYCKINMQNDATPTKVKLLLFSFYVPPVEKLLSSNYFRNCSCSVCVLAGDAAEAFDKWRIWPDSCGDEEPDTAYDPSSPLGMSFIFSPIVPPLIMLPKTRFFLPHTILLGSFL